jgi:urease accessory protein
LSDSARLRLFQLVSPALPVGAFSYSEGLEVLVQAGRLTAVEPLEAWLRAELLGGAITLEVAALAPLQALLQRPPEGMGEEDTEDSEDSEDSEDGGAERARQGWSALTDLDGWLLAQREAPELRAQQRQMGLSLLLLLADLGWPLPAAGGAGPSTTATLTLAWPAAFAWAACCLGLGSPAIEEAYLYGWVANQISAAVRLVPLGPTQGQRLQLALAPLIAERAHTLAAADPRTLWSSGVGASLAQLQHAELYSRLFRS